jgi:hypothetical protein
MQHVPTKATKGQMALVRRGATVYWLVRDEGEPDFRVVQRDSCGTQDISTIKLVIDSWGTESLTDIRWSDLTVRAEELPGVPAEYLRAPDDVDLPAVSLAATPPRRWIWWVVGIALVAVPVAALAIRRARSS